MSSLKAIELKFLLKLIGCKDYRSKIVEIQPDSKTPAAKRDGACEVLVSQGLVECDREISTFSIDSPGKTLLGLDTTSLPVTPDELKILKACQGSITPAKLGKTVPASERQQLIRGLADRGMLKISKTKIKNVWLSAQGKQYLLNECDLSSTAWSVTAAMLGTYVRFLRENLGPFSSQRLPTSQPRPDQSGGLPNTVVSIGSQTNPDAQEVLQQIEQLDQLLGTDNYLPIYHLREKLQSLLTREELDSRLYELQRNDRIELSSLHDQGDYSDQQVSAGIAQNHGRSLFFIAVL